MIPPPLYSKTSLQRIGSFVGGSWFTRQSTHSKYLYCCNSSVEMERSNTSYQSLVLLFRKTFYKNTQSYLCQHQKIKINYPSDSALVEVCKSRQHYCKDKDNWTQRTHSIQLWDSSRGKSLSRWSFHIHNTIHMSSSSPCLPLKENSSVGVLSSLWCHYSTWSSR